MTPTIHEFADRLSKGSLQYVGTAPNGHKVDLTLRVVDKVELSNLPDYFGLGSDVEMIHEPWYMSPMCPHMEEVWKNMERHGFWGEVNKVIKNLDSHNWRISYTIPGLDCVGHVHLLFPFKDFQKVLVTFDMDRIPRCPKKCFIKYDGQAFHLTLKEKEKE